MSELVKFLHIHMYANDVCTHTYKIIHPCKSALSIQSAREMRFFTRIYGLFLGSVFEAALITVRAIKFNPS